MCGRFALESPLPALQQRLQGPWPPGLEAHYAPRPLVRPGEPVLIQRQEHGRLEPALVLWGLVPDWIKDPLAPGPDGRTRPRPFNARSETVAEKATFRGAWRHRQWCVIPAEGFFEPSYESGKAVRWRIESADGAPMALAGIWESWRGANGEPVLSFSMLTIRAGEHPVMRRFHRPEDEKRSVVLLQPHQIDPWLSASTEQALAMLEPFDPSTVRTVESPRPARTARTAAPATPAESVPRTDGLFD